MQRLFFYAIIICLAPFFATPKLNANDSSQQSFVTAKFNPLHLGLAVGWKTAPRRDLILSADISSFLDGGVQSISLSQRQFLNRYFFLRYGLMLASYSIADESSTSGFGPMLAMGWEWTWDDNKQFVIDAIGIVALHESGRFGESFTVLPILHVFGINFQL
ncbi:MAG: hypothetical protein ACOH5I_18040 [Oligoflexus sp.]